MQWLLPLACVLLAALLARRDARRLSPGVFLLAALILTTGTLATMTVDALGHVSEDVQTIGLAVMFVMLVLTVPVLDGFLLINGVIMLRREGRSLANLVSLILGLGIFGALVLIVMLALHDQIAAVLFLTALMLPIATLGTLFVAFLLWAWVYGFIARRRPIGDIILVLGAGLINGKVPPLLASRIRRGIEVWETSGRAHALVVSGGQGDDESRPEGVAMAEYAREHGVPASDVVIEDRATTTDENIDYSMRLVEAKRVTVVTSNYHAFRAATLLRRKGIAGDALGARTAAYYLPSALIREYAALLRDRLVMTIVLIALSLLPLIAMIVVRLFNL